MFRIIKKKFIILLSNIVNGSNHTKWVSLSNQKCITQHANVNVNLMEENVTQINGGITISVKNVMHVKKIIFGILLYVVVKMENI